MLAITPFFVSHDEDVLDGPGRREGTFGHHYLREEMNNSRSDNDQDQQDFRE
jgi:hypothetical protein